jgi:nucleotide-binding universal stress UspA family protein
MFKTIVVGVDGREGGRDALWLAARLAQLDGGALVAVRALPFDYYVSRAGSPPYASLGEHDAKRQLQADLAEAGVEARVHVFGDRSPARALQRVAEHERADVIVVGATHHGRLGRAFDDDAVATLHGSSCPVAVAPRGLAKQASKPIERIGVGFDGGTEARQAFALAAAIAGRSGATIAVRSVIGPPVNYADFTAYDTDWLERATQAASADIDELLAGAGVEGSGQVVVGTADDELARLSADVDLLVVGSRAWGPVRRVMIGSTAASLTHRAHCPVLVLPRGAATGEPGEQDPGALEHEAPASA